LKKSRSKSPLTRRHFLGRAGALLAGGAAAPFVLSGCGSSTTGTGGATGVEGDKVKVGILHSLSGFMAISEVSLRDAELMAIDEINAAGGVLGKKIEAKVEDPASDFDKGFPEKARKLLEEEKVATVFGCWTSGSRKSVLKVFEKANGLLWYPVQYEGNECAKNVIYTGAAPNQQIIPAIDYLVKKMNKKKFYLLGSDYVFPRTANQIVKAVLSNVYKMEPIAEKYADLKEKDFKGIVDEIKKAEPDVIFSTVNGDSNISLYNELDRNGLTADKVPACAMSVAEDELRGLIGKCKIEGQLAAWNYFQSVGGEANKKFVADFKKKYDKAGDERVTDDPIEAAYFQVYLWKAAVEKAKSFEVDKILEAIHDEKSPITFAAPGGEVKIDPKNQHTWKPFRMGKVKADGQFEILVDSEIKSPIRPDPYPPVAYKQDCDWIKDPKTGVVDR
jgi:urea transport system substrate-binding protein